MFGTFTDEREDRPCYYGITHALHSWNPIWANLHIWVETAKLAWQTESWHDKLLIWFKPPSWTPEDVETETHDWRQPRFDPAISNFTRVYCFIQYWLFTAAGLAAVLMVNSLPYALGLTVFVAVALSFYAQGRMLEGRPDAMKVESYRLGAVALAAAAAPMLWPEIAIEISMGVLAYCVVCGLTVFLALRTSALNSVVHSLDPERNIRLETAAD